VGCATSFPLDIDTASSSAATLKVALGVLPGYAEGFCERNGPRSSGWPRPMVSYQIHWDSQRERTGGARRRQARPVILMRRVTDALIGAASEHSPGLEAGKEFSARPHFQLSATRHRSSPGPPPPEIGLHVKDRPAMATEPRGKIAGRHRRDRRSWRRCYRWRSQIGRQIAPSGASKIQFVLDAISGAADGGSR